MTLLTGNLPSWIQVVKKASLFLCVFSFLFFIVFCKLINVCTCNPLTIHVWLWSFWKGCNGICYPPVVSQELGNVHLLWNGLFGRSVWKWLFLKWLKLISILVILTFILVEVKGYWSRGSEFHKKAHFPHFSENSVVGFLQRKKSAELSNSHFRPNEHLNWEKVNLVIFLHFRANVSKMYQLVGYRKHSQKTSIFVNLHFSTQCIFVSFA